MTRTGDPFGSVERQCNEQVALFTVSEGYQLTCTDQNIWGILGVLKKHTRLTELLHHLGELGVSVKLQKQMHPFLQD